VYANIAAGKPLSSDAIWTAAQRARLDADLHAMPMGLHTYVDEGGQAFSGGQRQRLLIARAFTQDPALLLFDEAMSSLDSHIQAAILDEIARFHGTRVLIAHRHSTIARADRVIALAHGTVVFDGSYTAYRRWWSSNGRIDPTG
jgi:ABC-type bacteriocin/lantibiotic exporter with double-glycine peptidase domain